VSVKRSVPEAEKRWPADGDEWLHGSNKTSVPCREYIKLKGDARSTNHVYCELNSSWATQSGAVRI